MTNQDPSNRSDVVQVVMLDLLLPRLEQWLFSQGLTLGRMPGDEENDLPTYVVGVQMARAERDRLARQVEDLRALSRDPSWLRAKLRAALAEPTEGPDR
jgi:hypothetical protein